MKEVGLSYTVLLMITILISGFVLISCGSGDDDTTTTIEGTEGEGEGAEGEDGGGSGNEGFDAGTTVDAGGESDSGMPSDVGEVDSGVASDAGEADTGVVTDCSSGSYWKNGNHGSPNMLPGKNCMQCHNSFTSAGTVMGAQRDVDNCNGVQNVTIEITDKNGNVVKMTSNSAGNFYTKKSLVTPINVKLMLNGKERLMNSTADSGKCASCHTADSSVGRIVAPE